MKRTLVSIMINFVVVFLIASFIVYYFTSPFIKSRIESFIHESTGFDCQIGEVSLRADQWAIIFKEVKISNPDEFEENRFVEIPLLKCSVNIPTIWSNRIVFRELALQLQNLHTVQNSEKENNIIVFFKRLRQSFGVQEQEQKGEKRWLIKRFFLHIDRVHITDYSRTPPYNSTIPIDYIEVFNDLSTHTDVTESILKKVRGKVLDYFIQDFLKEILDESSYLKMIRNIFDPFRRVFSPKGSSGIRERDQHP